MTHTIHRSFAARISTRLGLLLLAVPALALHLVVGFVYALRSWAERMVEAWREA